MQDQLENALAEIYEPVVGKAIKRAIDDHTSSAATTNRAMRNAVMASMRLAQQTLRLFEERVQDSEVA